MTLTNKNLKTTLGGVELSSCIMNASGVHCISEEELEILTKSNVGAVVTKSSTIYPRDGNPHPRYFTLPNGSINSMGLPNMGIDYYLNYLKKTKSDKLNILSIAGLTFEENVELVYRANECNQLSQIELNLSCPNLPGKPQIGYDFEMSDKLLSEVFKISDKKIGVKLPPYFDISHFESMSSILNKHPLTYVCCINSIGNGFWVDYQTNSTVIKPKSGFGGIGGDYIKPTALANVRMFHKLLNNIDIVGCGGVKSGQDVFEHILCGAKVVQIGTTLWEEGIGCFDRIINELLHIMNNMNYTSIEEFRGKIVEI